MGVYVTLAQLNCSIGTLVGAVRSDGSQMEHHCSICFLLITVSVRTLFLILPRRATGIRTGAIGPRPLPPTVTSAPYSAPPEALSFTFDDDGFCTRLTAAAVMDPLQGNTGGLGGVYGLLYATGTPASGLKTRSWNGLVGHEDAVDRSGP